MKQGIHLGSPLDRTATIRRVVWGLMLAVTALQTVALVRTRRDVTDLEARITRAEQQTDDQTLSPVQRATAVRLRLVATSGLPDAHSPTVLLGLLARALPVGVTLAAVTIRPAPPTRVLLIEASTELETDVTEFQRRIAASPLVEATNLLEERRSAAGTYSFRFEASLTVP